MLNAALTLSFLRSAPTAQEDAVLLRHVLQCGTKQWGELERSGQLKRSNKSCCNRYIFLRRKFTDRFHQNFLRKHLGAAAFSRPLIPLDGHSQPLLCQDFKQQQQQRSEGVGAVALTFGGLSYKECVMAFLAPNARCCLPATPPNLSSLATPPPASQTPFPASETAVLSAAAASTTEFPFSRDAVPVAAASSAAALRRAVKRPRDDCIGRGDDCVGRGDDCVGRGADCVGRGADQRLPGGCDSRLVRSGLVRDGLVQGGMVSSTERRHQSAVAEQFEQQGASRSVQQAADEALLEALLQEERRQLQQGGAGSRAQRVLWPRVGSESALPDDRVDWPHVASESARDLPHDVLLGDRTSAQRAALSAPPPTQPLAPLPTAMASPLAALPGSAPGSTSSCIAEVLAGSTCGCGTEEQEYVDACIIVLDNGSSTDNNSNGTDNNDNSNSGNDNQSDRDKDALFLDTPMAHLLLAGSALAVPLASGPQAQGPAPPGAAGPPPGAAGPPPGAAGPPSRAAGSAVAEWAAEQGGAGEAGADWHRQQQGLTQEATLAQWKACGSTPSRAAAALPIRCSTGSLFDTPCHAASVA
ncbi:unnamed protein product [Closterium sp. NIES-64]|nr:unnamed protein product [Closterium sp. NIES-64]